MKKRNVSSSSQPKHILVLDDDRGVLSAVSTVLTNKGYIVEAVSDEEYLESKAFRANLPDLILLDMLLSGADGREICLKLKADPVTKHIPVIIFTAASNALRSVKKAKADAFLPKPFSIAQLMSVLEKLLMPEFRP